jgi:hypothetical protein
VSLLNNLIKKGFYYNLCEYNYYKTCDRLNFEYLLLNTLNFEPVIARRYMRKRKKKGLILEKEEEDFIGQNSAYLRFRKRKIFRNNYKNIEYHLKFSV